MTKKLVTKSPQLYTKPKDSSVRQTEDEGSTYERDHIPQYRPKKTMFAKAPQFKIHGNQGVYNVHSEKKKNVEDEEYVDTEVVETTIDNNPNESGVNEKVYLKHLSKNKQPSPELCLDNCFILKGEKGDKGKDGVDGKDGKDGVDGKDGKDGEKFTWLINNQLNNNEEHLFNLGSDQLFIFNSSKHEEKIKIVLPDGVNNSYIKVKDLAEDNKTFEISSKNKLELYPGFLIGPDESDDSDVNYRNYEWMFHEDTWLLMNIF